MRAEGLYPKIAAIQRNIKAVVREKADDAAFEFVPAPEVFNRVCEQINYQRLVVLPSLADLPTRHDAGDGRALTRGLVHVKFVDSDTDESDTSVWAGEAITDAATSDRAISWLTTSALKSFYLHTFLISVIEGVATIDADQQRGLVGAQQRNGVSDRELFDLIKETIGERLEQIADLPVAHLIGTLEAVNAAGAAHREQAVD